MNIFIQHNPACVSCTRASSFLFLVVAVPSKSKISIPDPRSCVVRSSNCHPPNNNNVFVVVIVVIINLHPRTTNELRIATYLPNDRPTDRPTEQQQQQQQQQQQAGQHGWSAAAFGRQC